MDPSYPNPEEAWHQQRRDPQGQLEEVHQRLGGIQGEVVPLTGGLANDSYRVGEDRVLRIYRRDTCSLPVELNLLSYDWCNFRVPRVFEVGEDYLLLEYVPHRSLRCSREHGDAVGLALAEIHQLQYEDCGLLGPTLQLTESWQDFPRAMMEFVQSQEAVAAEDVALLNRTAGFLNDQQSTLRDLCAGPVLQHGDFKASNLHWADDERLLILDWEFAYSGPAWMDLGQLIRWGIPQPFLSGFEAGYAVARAPLGSDWQRHALCFDLVNLVGLLAKATSDSQQTIDCRRELAQRLDRL